MIDRDLSSYYRNRAHEYERVYEKPERQEDLALLTQMLKELFSGKELLEIACGTGYWTERIAMTAREILATDINNSVLNIARSKKYSNAKVTFRLADFNNLHGHGKHESLFGGFIWSHIKVQDLPDFIRLIKEQVIPGGRLVFIDNNFVKGSSTPIAATDKEGNTYQNRELETGAEYQILKNFPTEKLIRKLLKKESGEIKFTHLRYYWLLEFTNT